MGTPYSNIYDRFSVSLQDYELDELFSVSQEDYELYLLAFLKKALIKFKKCTHDLSARDDTTLLAFTDTLTEEEEEILSVLMLVEWFTKEYNRLIDIRMSLSDTDYKRYSEAQNMREKTTRLRQMKIDADKLIIDYTYDNADLTTLG